ncbi:hypothetical protein [Falsiroseomonas sp.]|uniref:hypothetical protein n=1 Tax=Falsiroseomonas sp. TaxID=2870721 RepID=UPI0035643B9B
MLIAEPEALLAARLVERTVQAGPAGLIFVACSEPRAARLHLGYAIDERVDEPGEAVLHGQIADIYPAWAETDPAWRLRLEDGCIAAIHCTDIVTQRSLEAEIESVTIGPASELVLPPGHPLLGARPPGLDHSLPAFGVDLVAPLALLPKAAVILDDDLDEPLARRRTEVAEAYRMRLSLRPPRDGEPPVRPPEALYLDAEGWRAAIRWLSARARKRSSFLMPRSAPARPASRRLATARMRWLRPARSCSPAMPSSTSTRSSPHCAGWSPSRPMACAWIASGSTSPTARGWCPSTSSTASGATVPKRKG